MRKRTVSIAIIVASVAVVLGPRPASAVSYADLAYRWAPVHRQDTHDDKQHADYIARTNFDGDWDMANNWENLYRGLLDAHAYYSVTETESHWFIVYGFFHPQDWSDNWWRDEHENDMEGAMLAVRKDGSTYGRLEAMVTHAHAKHYSYVPPGSTWRNGTYDGTTWRNTIDGTIRFVAGDRGSRPVTFQEAEGHGVFAWQGSDWSSFPGGDGIVYYPTLYNRGEVPDGGNDRNVKYRLIDIFAYAGLWAHRNDPLTFEQPTLSICPNCPGRFRGSDSRIPAPWAWDADDGSDLQAGSITWRSAELIRAYFDNTGWVSTQYVSNRYTRY